jgi:hypothetical protein
MGFLFFGKKTIKKLQDELSSISEKFTILQEKEEKKAASPLISKLALTNETLIVVTKEGNLFQKDKANKADWAYVQTLKDEEAIEKFMQALATAEQLALEEEKEQKKRRVENYKKLTTHPEFEFREDSLYLKNIKLSLPEVIVEGFLDVLDNPEGFQALKMFCYWLALNPNPESIEDAYRFIKHNNVKLTSHGLLVLYRSIVSKGATNKDLINFISRSWAKVKMWKKSPKTFFIYKENGEYKLIKSGTQLSLESISDSELIGNLDTLNTKLPELEENAYTDAHTHTMDIKIGSVYRMNEEEVDRDNRVECSNGLHVGSASFGISSFGDTKVLALVNPSKIRAVPAYDSQKMRVSEMFIAAVLEIGEDGKYIDTETDLVEMNDVYFSSSVEELEELAKGVNIKELAKHNLLPVIDLPSIENIVETLTEIKESLEDRVLIV